MKYVKQFSIILGISFLAELLEILIPFPIAASVYGLVIMLVGLITKLIPLEKVETAADFLVDAMSIMFVPATVGIMASVDVFKRDAASHLRDHGGIHGTDHDCDRPGIPAYYPGAEKQRCRSHADGRNQSCRR